MPLTDTILMIRPARFCYNAETAGTNFFQQPSPKPAEQLQQQAVKEFNNMVSLLESNGITVIVVEDTPQPPKPDAIFPNNWISTSPDGVVSIFPMQSANRRTEKRSDIVALLDRLFFISAVEDWSDYEKEEKFLEGTGSMVIDHQHKIIYACLSPRTDPKVLEKFAEAHSYRAISFQAQDEKGNDVYHTNVLLCLGEGFAVLCPKAITDHDERVAVAQLLEATGHDNIYLSFDQMHAFAGNMLQLQNSEGRRFILMSQSAFHALEEEKRERLQQYGELLPVDVSLIEQVAGGSVRCMMAEIFLEKRKAFPFEA